MSDFDLLRKSLPTNSRGNFDEGIKEIRAALQGDKPLVAMGYLWLHWTELWEEMAKPVSPLTPEETLEVVSKLATMPGQDQMRAIEFLGKYHGLVIERKLTSNRTERIVRVIYDKDEPQILDYDPPMPLLEAGDAENR